MKTNKVFNILLGFTSLFFLGCSIATPLFEGETPATLGKNNFKIQGGHAVSPIS